MKFIYLGLILASNACLAMSASNKPGKFETINIYYEEKGKIHDESIKIQDLNLSDNVSAITPHPSKNPNKSRNFWEGIFLNHLTKKAQITISDYKNLTVIAADDFTVQLGVNLISKAEVLIALKKDKKRLTWYDGGPQLIFPLDDKNIDPSFAIDSWWCWYVSAIILDELPPLIKFQSSNLEKIIDLRDLHGELNSGLVSLPSGTRLITAPKTPIKISQIKLLDLLRNTGTESKGKSIEISTYNGRHQTISDLSKYTVNFKWDNKFIDPAFGGPVQVCKSDTSNDSIFGVKRISIKE